VHKCTLSVVEHPIIPAIDIKRVILTLYSDCKLGNKTSSEEGARKIHEKT
jgi:hypothetical protein